MNLPFSLADLDNDDSPYPCRIGVFCDRCGTEVLADYVVQPDMTKAERFEVARTHLRENAGWSCTPGVDLCPGCAPAVPSA